MNKQPPPRTRKAGKSPPTAPAAKSRETTASRRASSPLRAGKAPKVDGEVRRAMVAQAAYFRAEKRGFVRGGELEDWLEAEREISHVLDE